VSDLAKPYQLNVKQHSLRRCELPLLAQVPRIELWYSIVFHQQSHLIRSLTRVTKKSFMLGGVYYVIFMALLISKLFFRLGTNGTRNRSLPFQDPKKVWISGPTSSNDPRYGYFPHPAPYEQQVQ
jgi:hypothetical protein